MKEELKHISAKAIPRALELAERYRLLNEPEQAESICMDVLDAEPGNQLAIRTMLLAISDQFGRRQSATVQHAKDVAARLTDVYERHYFSGVMMERWARAKMQENHSLSLVRDWVHNAMQEFEKAEDVRPAGDDSSVLRWNTCARLLKRLPRRDEEDRPEFGD